MIIDHPDRVCTYFAADYLPQVAFSRTLIDAAETLQTKLRSKHWGRTPAGGFAFRVPEHQQLFTLDSQRLYAQAVGLLKWQQEMTENGQLFSKVLTKLGVQTLGRIGFKVWAFLNTKMSHAEMVALLQGAFLVQSTDLEPICGKLDDALLQLHGNRKDLKVTLILAPTNADQTNNWVANLLNLEHFLEPKFFDAGMKVFRDRVAGDCLVLDIDVFRQEVPVGQVAEFLQGSLTAANEISTACVERLKSLQPRKGV
jgi:hypothetical protein